jgi:DNA-binding protein Alba
MMMMMTTIVRENTTLAPSSRPQVLPSVLLIGKKYAVEYIAPALFKLNTTGELVIKATGSPSIVTAVDVGKLVKRDVGDLVIKSITVGTNELTVVGGSEIGKRMSCIEIHLAKNITAPAVAIAAPETVAETVAPVIEETTTTNNSQQCCCCYYYSQEIKYKEKEVGASSNCNKEKGEQKEEEEEIGRLGAHTPAFSYISDSFVVILFSLLSFFSCLESMMAFSAGYGVTRDIVLGNSTVSLMSSTFVIQRIKRSMPSPKPPCGTEPYLRRSRYQS